MAVKTAAGSAGKSTGKKEKTAKTASDRDIERLPSREEARQVYEPAQSPRHARSREILRRLRAAPPQVMIMEGGTVDERAAMALWYAALHSCPEADAPCLECAACLQVGAGFHADVSVLDGRAGSIGIDAVRELRASLSEAPRGDGRRVVLLMEAQSLGVEAANALLKSLEEPRPKLCFALLAPQRERLLPTLVSRGWTLTLAWPEFSTRVPESLAPWVRALDDFLATGQGLFAATSVKGALDADMARQLIVCVQKGLATVMASGCGEASSAPFATQLGLLPEAGCTYVSDLLAQAQTSLDFMVNPALVMDWLGVRLYQAVSRSRALRRG